MTQAEIQFCKRTCDTATVMGIGARRYTDVAEQRFGYEWQLPSGQILGCQTRFFPDEKRALHAACKALAEHLINL